MSEGSGADVDGEEGEGEEATPRVQRVTEDTTESG
jgi:hypothetical protein